MTSRESLVLAARSDGVLRLTMNRPQARNALNGELIDALMAALAAGDAAARVVILAAAGPAYCSGHDLKEMTAQRTGADKGRMAFERLFAQCSRLMQAIVRHPTPVIAEVQGIATAAGCQLVASCDLAVASTAASFATPGVNIGLFCSTPAVALSRNLSRKHALEMLLTGEAVSAAQAWHLGLINRLTTPQELAKETMELAAQIAAKPTEVVKLGKATFYRQFEMGLDEAYDHASRVMVENILRTEAETGIDRFLNRRK